jgi:predicted NAD/FAD-binding protein
LSSSKVQGGGSDTSQVSLTYNMNILQYLSVRKCGNVLVTLNPLEEPDAGKIQKVMVYRHPVYSNAAVRGQKELIRIQGHRGIWYAGAWTGYGFHEDGFASGIWAGQSLGGGVDWEFTDLRSQKSRPADDTATEMLAKAMVQVIMVLLALMNAALVLVRFIWLKVST